MAIGSRFASFMRSRSAWVWVLPHVVLGSFVVALFALLAVLERHEIEDQKLVLARDAQWAGQTIRTRLENNVQFLALVARGIADGTLTRDAFHIQSTQHVANNPEFTHVLWVDESLVVRWTAPFETLTWNVGDRLSTPEQAVAFQGARRTGAPTYGMPPASADEGATIEVHVPIFRDRLWKGAVVGVYGAKDLLRSLAPEWFASKYRLVLETDERVFGATSSLEVPTVVTGIMPLDPPGHGLRLRVAAFARESNLSRDMLVYTIAGLVVLMVWSLWTLSAHVRRRLAAERERDRLFAEVRSESSFRKAMEESVLAGLRAVDLEGRITFVNPAFCEMVGYSEAELLGRLPPFPYWPEEEIPALTRLTEGWLRGESPRTGFEVRIRRKSGERFPARMYISPLVGDDGKQTGWMGSMIDITELRRAEELGRQHQERFQQTSRLIAMGEMASSIAHELNQPLAAIANYCSGAVNRLSGEGFQREEVLAAMKKASAQAERAGKIIRRVREFVNKREPNRAPVALADVVDDAIGFAQLEAKNAGIDIQVDVPTDLPPVFVDRVMIEQVVMNLVKNGVEAMHPPGGGRELSVRARVDGEDLVELAVADRGHGFPAADAEKLFTPFYTTKPEGMGMGLSICRSIVEFHGGRLWAQPNPGGGSVFRVTLPLRP